MISRQYIFTVFPFFTALFFGLMLLFPKFPGNLMNWDSNPTVLTPIALVKYKTLYFNQLDEGKRKLAVDRSDLDSYYYFVVDANNNVVSGYPIFSGLLMVPIYLVASVFKPNIWNISVFPDPLLIRVGSLTSVLFTVITGYFFYLLVKERTKSLKLALFGVLIFIFGSPVLSVSSRFVWQHTFSLLFLTGLLLFYQRKYYFPLFLFSLLAVLTRPQTLLLCLPFVLHTLYAKYKSKQLFIFTLQDYVSFFLMITALAIQIYYSLIYLHHPLKLAPLYDASYFSAPILVGVSGILFSLAKGVFVYTPVFLLATLFMFGTLKQKKSGLYLLIGLGLGMFTVVTGMWKAWSGGWSLGYRLMLETVPFFTLITCDLIKAHRFKQNVGSLLIVGALVASFVFNTLITGYYGECNYHGTPTNIDKLQGGERLKKLWLDSPLLRCIKVISARP